MSFSRSFLGSLAELGEQGQPQARRGADDMVVCAERGAAGTCVDGPGKGRAVRAKSFCLCQRGNISARERLPVPENNRVFGTRAVRVCTYAPTRCY